MVKRVRMMCMSECVVECTRYIHYTLNRIAVEMHTHTHGIVDIYYCFDIGPIQHTHNTRARHFTQRKKKNIATELREE